jgi:hypothetical protein
MQDIFQPKIHVRANRVDLELAEMGALVRRLRGA